jgi:hypothetical protein
MFADINSDFCCVFYLLVIVVLCAKQAMRKKSQRKFQKIEINSKVELVARRVESNETKSAKLPADRMYRHAYRYRYRISLPIIY